MKTKHSTNLSCTTLSTGELAIRNIGGIVCSLPRVTKYNNQHKRYEQEIEESKANQKLFVAAPKLLDAVKRAVRIKDIWLIKERNCPPEHKGELIALNNMLLDLEQAIKATE